MATKKQIKSYQLLEEVAAGGHATVHRVYDSRTNQALALKVLHPHLSKDPAYLVRFEREANLASSLDHPNIVRIYEVGKEAEAHFIAMEFLPLTLEHLLQTGPLSVARAVDIARQVACGLEAARLHEIVHRDIKPQNILLDAEGNAKITDFGIARALDVSTMTNSGLVMGTPQYMAPEQAKGTSPDSRADLYSLGVLLYQMLAGVLPFKGDNPWEVIRRHVEETPDPIDKVRVDVPKDLAAIVERSLEKDPELRFQTPQEMAVALAALEDRVGRPSPGDISNAMREMLNRPGAASGPATMPLPEGQKPPMFSTLRARMFALGAVAVVTAAIAATAASFWARGNNAEPTVVSETPMPAIATSVPAATAVTVVVISEVRKNLAALFHGQTGLITLEGQEAFDLGVMAVGVSAAEDMSSSVMTIAKLPSRPTAMLPPGDVYSYLQVSLPGVPEASIAKTSLRFKLPQAWLVSQKAEASTVALYQFDGRWTKLRTTQVETTADGLIYEAEAPHFAYFAIAAGATTAIEETPTPPVADILVSQQTVIGGGSSGSFTVGSSPWKLQYRTSWSGPLVLNGWTESGMTRLAEHDVQAGLLYETYVYSTAGTMSLAAEGVPQNGEWRLWATSHPTAPPSQFGVRGTVLSYTGTSEASTPMFEVTSSPWLLRYETTWSGPFTLMATGPDGSTGDDAVMLFTGSVTAGVSYETYVYGLTGQVHLSSTRAPANGRWVVRVTDDPDVPLPDPPAILTYSGTGLVNSPPFLIDSPSWRLVYMATWKGHFTLVAMTSGGPQVLMDRDVEAGIIYEAFVTGLRGPMHLTVDAAPSDRAWSVSIWNGQPS